MIGNVGQLVNVIATFKITVFPLPRMVNLVKPVDAIFIYYLIII